MALAPGTRLGPYEIVAPIGAGGMGEIYRARDGRLSRDVAVKVLPATFIRDQDRLRRFEQEARAAGQLNHPNIVAVYDAGTHEGIPYVVQELLEGETLRQRMGSSRLPARKALEYARQVAQGLAAAHQKGIVHRDLKPENLFVTRDGLVKILDFGLAKLRAQDPAVPASTQAPTQAETGAGVVLGTVGYMAPEQVRGQPADHRSDIFSFGSILYEMLAGRRAFEAPSSVEAMNAILHAEPESLSRAGSDLPAGLERVVQHCLEKRPDERFQSARDLAFQLEALSPASSESAGAMLQLPRAPATRLSARMAAAGLILALAAAAAGFLAGRWARPAGEHIDYRQLTFRKGSISGGRFSPDGQSVIYSAAWDGGPTEMFSTWPGSPESRPLGLRSADVLSISHDGAMLLLMDAWYSIGFMRSGTLAQAPVAGGVPRPMLENVGSADWGPDGKSLAVARTGGGKYRLEYPLGKVLYETQTWISFVRVSPDGRHVAFLDHPLQGDNRGRVAVADTSGKVTFLTEHFSSSEGVAWSPGGEEIWFTAGQAGTQQSVHGVDLSGRQRMVSGAPGSITLQDVSRDGRVLLARDTVRRGMIAKGPDEASERDLSLLDWSRPAAMSPDGRFIVFDEQGQGGGPEYAVYLRRTDGSPPVRLGSGSSTDLSPDGRWALTLPVAEPDRIVLLPTGAGEARTIPFPGYQISFGYFLPDSRRILMVARAATGSPRGYLTDTEGSTPRPVTPEGIGFTLALSPDGSRLATAMQSGVVQVHSLEGDAPVTLQGAQPGDDPIVWSPDGAIYVARSREMPAGIHRIDTATGERRLWRELVPPDPAGVSGIDWVMMNPAATAWGYSYRQRLSTLYLVKGLR